MIYFALCFSETCRKLCLIKWSVNEFRWFYFRLTFSSFLYFFVTAPAPRDQRDDRIFSFKPASLIQLLSVSLLCVPSCVPKRKCLYLCPPTHQKSRSMLMQTADTPMAHSSIFVCAKSFFIIIYCTTELFFSPLCYSQISGHFKHVSDSRSCAPSIHRHSEGQCDVG